MTAPASKGQRQAPKKNTITPGISLAAGAVAGAVEAASTYPFEFAKTRAQLSQRLANQGSKPVSRNPLAVILSTARQDGIRAIYTGCSTLIFGTAFKAGVRCSRGILAGMVAGTVESVVAVTPTERIKTALIDDARSSTQRYNGGFHALRAILAESGITEVYRGLISTTLKQSATSACRMGSYNIIKEAVLSRTNIKDIKNPAVTFAMGATAGTITVYMTQPFDTIKTRAQGAKGASTLEALRDVLKDGGVRAFWRGSSMRLGRLVLSGGIVFTVYENVAALLMSSRARSIQV
ncbi:hypothetical protein BDV06DRAFT_215069 [Aspergillus oleicola]